MENAQEITAAGKESRKGNKFTNVSSRDLERKIDELIVVDDEDTRKMRRKLKEQARSRC